MKIDHRTVSSDRDVEANVDAAIAFYDVFVSPDPAAIDALVTPGWTVHPPAPGGVPGLQGYRPLLADFRRAFPACEVTIDDAFGVADRVAVRCTMRATHDGPFLGIPPTGKAFKLRTCDIHRLENGCIAQSWHLEDFLGFLTQVGAAGP